MDWTKAKNILIVALILTNLVLIFAHIIKTPNEDQGAHSAAVQSYLEKKNIFIKTEIPIIQEKMSVVEVAHSSENDEAVAQEMKDWKVISKKNRTDEVLKKSTEAFLQKCHFDGKTVQLKSIKKFKNRIKVEYKNQLGSTPVEESYMIFTIEDGRLIDFQREWLDILGVGKSKQKVIPAKDALMNFAQEMTREGNHEERINIEQMELVYWLDYKSIPGETPRADTALPAWKITYNEDGVTYIPAYE
ncbi:MAG: two-component system regulatory protein YycI [Anaerovorax sp.]